MNSLKLVVILFILTSHLAWAYVDPGSGSLLVQALLATLVGIGVYFKNIRLWFTSLFGGNKDKNEHE